MKFGKNQRTNFVKFALANLLIGLGTIIFLIYPAQGQRDLQQFTNSIQSVEQVKQELRQTFQGRDGCLVGSCFNSRSTSICETVAALDVQVNGQIVGGMTFDDSDGEIPVSDSDLELFKLIFSQCKPTNYQYWNWPMMLHVWYAPSDEVDQQIRRGLGFSSLRVSMLD